VLTGGPARSSRAERAARGKAARRAVPLDAHATLELDRDRDPVAVLIEQEHTRVPDLLPIRHGRMLSSAFAFYRGAAAVMAADLRHTPTTTLWAQLCGDAHLSNFGAYASPERRLVFDINDFDETLPGPFEWDVKRLATSLVVAGRDNGLTKKQCRKAALAAVEQYRTAMHDFATRSILDVWYARLDVDDVLTAFKASLSPRKRKQSAASIEATERHVAKARTRDSLQAIGKLTTVVNGRRRIASRPPLIVPIDELAGVDIDRLLAQLHSLVADYSDTLQTDRRHLLDHFTLTDVAHKVVGVGSVGTRTWILLLESAVEGEALLLQAKQAETSVLARHVGKSEHENHGERVVAGQHLMQASSDIFLGWVRAKYVVAGLEDDYYVRQLRDWKVSVALDEMRPESMVTYGRLCGWTLARAHARSGDRHAIAAYLGASATFANAVGAFAEAYADENERYHAALAQAVEDGRIAARPGM
jgi:uncharacterized protein (DUF2252 family)